MPGHAHTNEPQMWLSRNHGLTGLPAAKGMRGWRCVAELLSFFCLSGAIVGIDTLSMVGLRQYTADSIVIVGFMSWFTS